MSMTWFSAINLLDWLIGWLIDWSVYKCNPVTDLERFLPRKRSALTWSSSLTEPTIMTLSWRAKHSLTGMHYALYKFTFYLLFTTQDVYVWSPVYIERAETAFNFCFRLFLFVILPTKFNRSFSFKITLNPCLALLARIYLGKIDR